MPELTPPSREQTPGLVSFMDALIRVLAILCWLPLLALSCLAADRHHYEVAIWWGLLVLMCLLLATLQSRPTERR